VYRFIFIVALVVACFSFVGCGSEPVSAPPPADLQQKGGPGPDGQIAAGCPLLDKIGKPSPQGNEGGAQGAPAAGGSAGTEEVLTDQGLQSAPGATPPANAGS